MTDRAATSGPEACEGCGHVWDAVSIVEVPARLRSAAAGFTEVLARGDATMRPEPGRWSALEYACHVRDVFLVLRERVMLATMQDTPTPTPMYPDGRVDAGFYANEDPATVAGELTTAAELLIRTFGRLDEAGLARGLVYAYPAVAVRSLAWVASQAVHEAEHHLADARA